MYNQSEVIEYYKHLVGEVYAFEIHECANGARWSHDWWVDNVYKHIHDKFMNNNSVLILPLSKIIDGIKVTTLLGDTFEAINDGHATLNKFINGVRVNGSLIIDGIGSQ